MVSGTPQEKMLIVHTHKYFMAETQQRLDPLGRAVRERVAKSLALSESMVARVLGPYNVHGEEAFAVPPDAHQEELVRMDVSYIRDCKRNPRADSKEVVYVEQHPLSEITPAPTMKELQDLAGEATDKVHCSNIMGEMDTSAQFEEYEIAKYGYNVRGYS
ncbi:hypothetical protein JG687_00013959 [Phytophthora cactorum]|uniref:Uncharacterized protein n=2 Tax=Phytophthora cactorum TaxID=29920 RepID=A0A8T1TZY0_9STRA|nr:hypothetical protein JG687_00013959 [Phytophthora cactorum]